MHQQSIAYGLLKLKGIELTSPWVRAMHEHVGAPIPTWGRRPHHVGSFRSFEQGL
jgi:hypothetical protein